MCFLLYSAILADGGLRYSPLSFSCFWITDDLEWEAANADCNKKSACIIYLQKAAYTDSNDNGNLHP